MGLLAYLFVLGVAFIGGIRGNYFMISSEESKKLKQFTEYKGFALTGKTPYFVNEKEADYRQCIQMCDNQRPKCKAVNVLKSGDSFTCSYFNTSSSTFEENADMIYISKDPPACLAYCKELEFMNLCGKCNCTNICGSKFNHFCDCTEALKEPKKNCEEIRTSGFKKPAMYNFKGPKGENFQGFCEIRENPDVLWLTMLRRFKGKIQEVITMDQFTEGFGKPHDEIHWLGLERLHHFTKNDNTILRIEVATFSYHFKWFGEYGNFKITKNNDDSYGYTASDFRSNFCLWDGLKDQGSFDKCDGKNPWNGICDESEPFRSDEGIKWGGFIAHRITFLLRHGSLPPIPNLTIETGVQIENRILGDIEYMGKDFCITFNLYTKKNDGSDSAKNILCFPPKPGPDTCVFSVYNKQSVIYIYHKLGKSLTKSKLLTVIPKENEWINLKLTQMRMNLKPGHYKFRAVVNNKVEYEVELNNLEDLKNVQVGLGRAQANGKIHNGLIHGLFVNGRQFL